MQGSRNYGGAIWTNHALERMEQRYLPQDMAWQAFQHPDTSFAGKQPGTTESIKQFGSSKVTIISKQNEQREWIILSCWIDPPLPGTKDYKKKQAYKSFQKAGFWGKLWLTLRHQLFGF
jgi:hypothetical protein